VNCTIRTFEISNKILSTILRADSAWDRYVGWQHVVHPNFKQLSRTRTGTNIYFISLRFTVFVISCRFRFFQQFELHYLESKISNKMLGMLLRTDSVWDREILAHNLFVHPNFKELSGTRRNTCILYHCLCNFMQIPFMLKFWTTLFGIVRFRTKC